MKESDVEKIVREYVLKKYKKDKGWIVSRYSNKLKKRGEHGIDISLYNQKLGDRIIIEVKKWSDNNAANHSAFYTIFGQFLSRVETVPTKIYMKRRKMVMVAPVQFVEFMRKKIQEVKNSEGKKVGMRGGWKLFGEITNLRIWPVDMKKRRVLKEIKWRDIGIN